MLKIICYLLVPIWFVAQLNACNPSNTTFSVFNVQQKVCSGQLIFEENFDELNKTIWTPEVSLWGGGVSVRTHDAIERCNYYFFINRFSIAY